MALVKEELIAHHLNESILGRTDCGIGDDVADVIDAVLVKSTITSGIKVDRKRLGDCKESWVYVTIDKSCREGLPVYATITRGPFLEHGILTWRNSD